MKALIKMLNGKQKNFPVTKKNKQKTKQKRNTKMA